MFSIKFKQAMDGYVKTFQKFQFPVIICDTTFQVYWANTVAHVNYGMLTDTEVLRRLLSEYNLEYLAKAIKKEDGKTIAGMPPFNNMRLTLTPIFSEDEYIGILLVLSQPDDLPSLEKLQNVSKASSVFSTEIRERIDGIFSTMDVAALKADLLQTDWIKPHLTSIANDSYQILRLSSNVTKFARFRNHEADLNLTSYNILGWLRKIGEAITIVGKGMGIPIHFEINEGNEYLTLDSKKFETAFFNVLHNALFYTKPGNEVFIRTKQEEDFFKITIEDKGVGIPSEIMHRLYEPYFSYAPPGFTPNMGLGLTIAHLVFTSHEGDIHIESVEGKGTKATILLPIQNSLTH